MPELVMSPAAGERLLRFVGDTIRFALRRADQAALPEGWRACLRTNLGRAALQRAEIIKAQTSVLPVAGASWRDIPLQRQGQEWAAEFALLEVGFFKAKAYAVDPAGRQYWPDGSDFGVTVHPDAYRTANTIYCAFARMFGAAKAQAKTFDEKLEGEFKPLDQAGYAIIPPSGKLRDLTAQAPHIFHTLGCRILHLLPINPTPATYARFGRYGSPYAGLDFTAIDPALVEFDRRTTAVDQFRELTDAVHAHGARIFLDLAINHTGWGSRLLNEHPEWFVRDAHGTFVSPGAWGTIWEDLVELAHRSPDLWSHLAEAFLTWCRRGVDGFRCDAGYKVPVAAWQFIIARVRQEFPDTIFLLEGLGGSWDATEALITDGGMQWAYSELFQNHAGRDVAHYLDYSLRQSRRAGYYIHYSETHDNNRLAAQGRPWSLLRNQLCALASAGGGYGFTCGVEWLAAEKVNVHRSSGLSWGNPDNLVAELGRLNRLLADHPCFFDGAALTRLSPNDSPVYALRRLSRDGADQVLVLVNLDLTIVHDLILEEAACPLLDRSVVDLLGQPPPARERLPDGAVRLRIPAAACYCLAAGLQPEGLSGDAYRRARAQAAWALTALGRAFPTERIGRFDWRRLAARVEQAGPRRFLAALAAANLEMAAGDAEAALDAALQPETYPPVVVWELLDRHRITPVPPDHWLLINDPAPFRVALRDVCGGMVQHLSSIAGAGRHFAAFAPNPFQGDAELVIQRFAAPEPVVTAPLRFLSPQPDWPFGWAAAAGQPPSPESSRVLEGLLSPAALASRLVLLTNGRGGMARLGVDLGRIHSKYDCLLGASLHASIPVDRLVLAKRARVWVIAGGFLSPLDAQNLVAFEPGPPAVWKFVANAGDGRTVEIHLEADMLDHANTTVLRFTRPSRPPVKGRDLPESCGVRLTVRVDIEDRNFHAETHRNPGADHHFQSHSRPLSKKIGFEFTPAADRRLRVYAAAGAYHHEHEWCEGIPHPVEQSRGQVAAGDAFSPGWFDLPLAKGGEAVLVLTADPADPSPQSVNEFGSHRNRLHAEAIQRSAARDSFGQQLARAVQAFIADRDGGKTVIAGYPWFLDWGRDSLICARGALAAGLAPGVKDLLVVFGRFEERGTLPNYIYGNDATNRDTSDAPLWYGMVCEEAAARIGPELYATRVDDRGHAIVDVLLGIAAGYAEGAPNGVKMDPDSGLIWSPKHFTWMDTNHPAGTPREGYPVEIQALWIRLLRLLAHLHKHGLPQKRKAALPAVLAKDLPGLIRQAEHSFQDLFWLEDQGYYADVLLASRGVAAASATRDNALRSNCLLAISLDVVLGERARRCVDAAARYLVVPGALRSLAPLPVSPPLPIHGHDGRLLNDPEHPYWSHYEGDEDTQRKPAYHNGTAWTWTFPVFCEALAKAWNHAPSAVAAARAYLGSMDRLLLEGCLGHLPEIVDGDAPHTQRGCDAQAWGVTEALRVWKMLAGNE